MTSKTDRRVLRTKKNIYSALFALAEEMPSDKITVTQLAERADINRKTFYMYYTGIEDLILKTETELYGKYEPFICTIDAVSPDFDVYEYFRQLGDMLESDIRVLRLLESRGRLLDFESRIRTMLVENLTAQLSGRKDPQELHLYLQYATAGIMSMLTDWLREPRTTMEELVTFLGRILLDGFRAVR